MLRIAICSLVAVLFSTMTLAIEWDGKDYHANSSSQQTAAEQILKKHQLRKSASVLDVGCGDGKITAALAERLSGDVVGLDISEQMLGFANKEFGGKRTNLRFVLGDAARLNFNEQFDAVTSFTVLQWVTDQKAALQGIYRALKPGGRVIVTMPKNYTECLASAILDLTYGGEYGDRFDGFKSGQVFFGVSEYEDLLKDAGFEDVQVAFVDGSNRFPSVAAYANFVKQWLPWAQVFKDPAQKDEFMNKLMSRYVAYCPADKDGSVVFHKQQLEASATKPLNMQVAKLVK